MCPPPSTVMSISIKQYFICGRSIGPFGPPEEEKGVKHVLFFLSLENWFSRAAWNLFDVGNHNPTHTWQVIFHSVRSSALKWGLRHGYTYEVSSHLTRIGCCCLLKKWYQVWRTADQSKIYYDFSPVRMPTMWLLCARHILLLYVELVLYSKCDHANNQSTHI